VAYDTGNEPGPEPRPQLYHDLVKSVAGSLHGMPGEHPAK
jgi:hypothetical protein